MYIITDHTSLVLCLLMDAQVLHDTTFRTAQDRHQKPYKVPDSAASP